MNNSKWEKCISIKASVPREKENRPFPMQQKFTLESKYMESLLLEYTETIFYSYTRMSSVFFQNPGEA